MTNATNSKTGYFFHSRSISRVLTTSEIIELAGVHGSKNDSARICLLDAITLLIDNNESGARSRALRSLQHSIGIFHADYIRAAAR